MKVWTVCILNALEFPEMSPWVSSFSTEEAAYQFKEKAEKLLEDKGVRDDWIIEVDSGEIDTDDYLSWIEDYYEDEEVEDDGVQDCGE